MLKSGYGLEQTQEFLQNRLNEDLPFAEMRIYGKEALIVCLKDGEGTKC
ncbi:MAG: hypothetical protein K2I01_05490 [Lachnospiraceae bacterium]|nr:hypothetical protein [Lachnospiraceae bacterium]